MHLHNSLMEWGYYEKNQLFLSIKSYIMRRILALLLTISFFSCNTDTNNYKLDGKAVGFEDGTSIIVYMINDNSQPEAIDTLIINNESFQGIYPNSDEMGISFLKVDKTKGNVLFFPENTDLNATIFKDDFSSSYVTGSQQNDTYRQFTKQIIEFNRQKRSNIDKYKIAKKEQDNLLATEIKSKNDALITQENDFKKQFVLDNSNSVFSVILLSEMVSRKKISSAEATSIINNLSPKLASTNRVTILKASVESMKKAEVDGQAPDFSAPTPEGDMLALNDVLGKYTIIDFWASWCKPCRRENPNVVKVYNQYHDKGLNIISVSLDKKGQKDRWLKAIEDDKLTWYHVSNLKGWSDPIAKTYNVRSIPATFLLDENGKIIAKNLRGKALDDKIASLLGDN